MRNSGVNKSGTFPKWMPILLFYLLPQLVLAQYSFSRWDSIIVRQGNDTLIHAFAGGLNNPQFSSIDLNGDLLIDMLIYDNGSGSIKPFLNTGTAGMAAYQYAPAFKSVFPELESWVLLRDFNCDGKQDIFSYQDHSLVVYRNTYDPLDGLSFEFFTKVPDTILYLFPGDLPGIQDMDGDGDIDFLTFEPGGSKMQLYLNQSIENYGTCDTIEFILADACWGKFEENFGSCTVTLGTSCKGTLPGKQSASLGATVLPLDLDGDADMDLIIGDMTCNQAYMLENGGSVSAAQMTAHAPLYPLSYPIDIQKFPAVFHIDVDQDGLKDLLAAPNGVNVSENTDVAWYYRNTGTPSNPDFTFMADSFMVDQMIDHGSGSHPAFFDFDGDSLPDLVIGNSGNYSGTGTDTARLALYRNTGTKEKPQFTLVTTDYLGLSNYGFASLAPAFGDLDGDEDMDLIIGDESGALHHFKNIAPAGSQANLVLMELNYKDIDVGQFATPQIVDANRDWLPDLLVGELEGNINYFQNIGTEDLADFRTQPTNSLFGGIDVTDGCCAGYSVPFMTRLDASGKYIMLVGTESGKIYQYNQIDGNLDGNFVLSDSMFAGIMEGQRTSISILDLNRDRAPEMVVGNQSGGISILRNEGDAVPPLVKPKKPYQVSVFPNPVSNILTLSITGLNEDDIVEMELITLHGKKIFSAEALTEADEWEYFLDVDGFPTGLYFLRFRIPANADAGNDYQVIKIVVK